MVPLSEYLSARLFANGRKLHFSWLFLGFAFLWATVSLVVFSETALHALNDVRPIAFDFPGNSATWTVNGDTESFQNCGAALCLQSASRTRSRLFIDIAVNPDDLEGVDRLVYEFSVTQWSEADAMEYNGPPSFILARARSASGRNLKNLGSVVDLHEQQSTQFHRRESTFHSRTASLQLAVIVQSTASAKIDDVRFYTVKLGAFYRLLRGLVLTVWAVALLALTFLILRRFSMLLKIIIASGFTLVLILGTGELASTLIRRATHVFSGNWNTQLTDIFMLSSNSLLGSAHVIFHLALTLCLALCLHRPALSTLQLVALNLSVAIGVECAQLGIPGRTADLSDLGAAALGTLAGILLTCLIARRRASDTEA